MRKLVSLLLVLLLGGCAPYRTVETRLPDGSEGAVRVSRYERFSAEHTMVHCLLIPRVGKDEGVCGSTRYWQERARRTGVVPVDIVGPGLSDDSLPAPRRDSGRY